LDDGWECYAEEDIREHFRNALFGLARMAAVLGEMKDALQKTTAWIEAADLEAAGFFSDVGRAYLQDNTQENGGNPPLGYLNPDNVGSTSEKRIGDIREFLYNSTPYGRQVAEWLKDRNIQVEFRDLKTASARGSCTPDGKLIILDVDYAGMSDIALAAILVHEATHSMNLYSKSENIPSPLRAMVDEAGVLENEFSYKLYPYYEEYAAHRAEAEFWLQVKSQAPYDDFMEKVVKIIFDSSGNYRPENDAHYRLHLWGYDGWINPLPVPIFEETA
jgi:hypothetical protein